MQKLQKATLRTFLTCMVITATLMLILAWTPVQEEVQGPLPIMRYALTFFVIGLASFLTWIVSVVLEIKNRIVNK